MFHAAFTKSLLGAAFLLAVSAPLAAGAGEVQNRIDRQQTRINQGVASGQLTRREYNSTEGHLQAIEAQRRRDLRANGGRLTVAEHRQLNREENRNSRRIYFDKHNLARQPGAR
jgi:PBP1b-binding outer membrane lipoprotein LpoB